MKIRESGMPEQAEWESFFDPEAILSKLGLTGACRDVIELGCGYGTFTIPASRRVSGQVYALDIDSTMLAVAAERAQEAQRNNIEFIRKDFVAEGTGLPDAGADYVMLFNILHLEHPVALLREARRNLSNNGLAGVIHWIPDPKTPRGPPPEIRPRPAECIEWAEQAGFYCDQRVIDLPPYHFGLVLRNAPDATAGSE
jgi:ubiquinone/menaquinone biosynthesis C-methylase UbiE